MTDAEIVTVEFLIEKIESAKTEGEKLEYANVRKKAVCNHSKIQEYYCGVKVPFPSHFSCDFCLEDELYQLWRCGVHTIGSCCGHGIKQPYIQVLDGESVQKMHELGYEKLPIDEYGNGVNCYVPKTYLSQTNEEEQDLIVKLPCKIGAPVWSSVMCRLDENGEKHPAQWPFLISMMDEWGQGFFLTREEAGAALKGEAEDV